MHKTRKVGSKKNPRITKSSHIFSWILLKTIQFSSPCLYPLLNYCVFHLKKNASIWSLSSCNLGCTPTPRFSAHSIQSSLKTGLIHHSFAYYLSLAPKYSWIRIESLIFNINVQDPSQFGLCFLSLAASLVPCSHAGHHYWVTLTSTRLPLDLS